jgi:tetratricopeptide (TPR) repeat protein
MKHSEWRTIGRAALALLLFAAAACAPKAPPALPAALKYPDFIYPVVPDALRGAAAVERIDRGWRFLQNGNTDAAHREFTAALKVNPRLYPAQAGDGYVALARHENERAAMVFAAAVAADAKYVPALIGRGQALLAMRRDDEALAAFEAALAVDPSIADLRSRVDVLRFRNTQDLIAAARSAATAGRTADARLAYERAIAATPGSAFLYRELGLLEHKSGDSEAGLSHLRKAVELDPADAASWLEIGGILEERKDFDGAVAAYRKAQENDNSSEVATRLAAASAAAAEAKLPAEFHAIAGNAQITRGDLAALIGIRLEALVRQAPQRQVVMTDIRRHWAAPCIALVAERGIMDAFENHTFQPRTRLRRVDLAAAVSRVIALAAERRPELRTRLAARPTITDVAPTHLSYPAVAAAVAAGLLPLLDGQRFQLARPVSGMEAIDAIERLRALVSPR